MQTPELSAVRICGGRIIDPAVSRDEFADLSIVDGVVVKDAPPNAPTIDAEGWLVCPGLMDIHVHLREPGQTHKETIATGTAAAMRGGFTFIACMPNTQPTLDEPAVVREVIEAARRHDHCDVGVFPAITVGRAGKELTDFAALRDAGVVALTDDGTGVEDEALMREAFERARELDLLLVQHCEYREISSGGVMHLGTVSRRIDLPGLDPGSEEQMLERDIALCRETGGRYHLAHVSTARAVELVRQAKADGLAVTAEVTPHHLLLTDEACSGADPNTKMHPPLRPFEDVEACRRGLADGTIDCVATDHAPHTLTEKSAGFLKAPPGVVGLETAVPLVARAMIESGFGEWSDLVAWFSTGPARVLRVPRKALQEGERADVTLIDPNTVWTVDPERFLSKGRNTPFAGWKLTGRSVGTIRGRRVSLFAPERLIDL